MTLVRPFLYLVDFYNPQVVQRRSRQSQARALPSFSEIGKLIKLLSKGENQDKSVLEVMFETYAKTYGTETSPCVTGRLPKLQG